MAEYRRGTGPNALPFGAATALNAQPQPRQQKEPPPVMENAEIPVEYAVGDEDFIPTDMNGMSEMKQLLLDAPYPEYQPSMFPNERSGRVPRKIVQSLPVLMVVAKDPSAPPMLRALYRATVRQLDAERRRGG